MVKQKQVARRRDVKSYQEKVATLGKLEEFDIAALLPDEKHSVAMCRLIATLAVVHNDFNDIDFALTRLQSQKPTSAMSVSKEWGLFNGLGVAIIRQKITITHELLEVLRESEALVASKEFDDLMKKLRPEHREAWLEVVDAARGKSRDTPMGKYLHHCRNKASGHYDTKIIYDGLKNAISRQQNYSPMLCRGNSALEVRFSFADAAVENVLLGSDPDMAKKLFFDDDNIYSSINVAIYMLVTRFINSRVAFNLVLEGERPLKPYIDTGAK